jgi:hypothetical protein
MVMRMPIDDSEMSTYFKLELLHSAWGSMEAVITALAVLELDRAGMTPLSLNPKSRADCLSVLKSYSDAVLAKTLEEEEKRGSR